MKKENFYIMMFWIMLFLCLFTIIYFVLLPGYKQKAYNQGFQDGTFSIIDTQTRNANLFWNNNGTVVNTPLEQICRGAG